MPESPTVPLDVAPLPPEAPDGVAEIAAAGAWEGDSAGREGDSAGISPEEDVISALPPASTDTGENQSDGHTKEKQDHSTE